MADDKPRAPRARKKTETEAAAKPAAKKSATATPRSRKKAAMTMLPTDVAVHAYFLWEQGEPGDATEHWLRAEQELAA